MSPNMTWLTIVLRLSAAPLFFGAAMVSLRSNFDSTSLAAGAALAILGAIQLVYWRQPWPIQPRRTLAALGAMIPPIALLQHELHVGQPLLWLYPAIVAGSGLPAPLSAVVVGLMGLAAVFPLHEVDQGGATLVVVLGTTHTILLSIVLAGLGMAAVRQLIVVNADLDATKAELAALAVARERERLARDLHDLLGRTLSLIAVKAELAARLSGGREPQAEAELREVQQLARLAVRDVREAISGYRAPTISTELASARLALRAAGIEVKVDGSPERLDPTHEATLAWALREGVTNVIKHSGGRNCWISLCATSGASELAVLDDGRGMGGGEVGTGLRGLTDRVNAQGGALEAESVEGGGFRLRVRLGATGYARQEIEMSPPNQGSTTVEFVAGSR